MTNWRDKEEDFNKLQDKLGFIRADWSHQDGHPEQWRVAGGMDSISLQRFDALAKTAGNKLLNSRYIKNNYPEILQEQNPTNRWFNAIRKCTDCFRYDDYATVHDQDGKHIGNIYLGSIDNLIRASELLCLKLSIEEEAFITEKELPLRLYPEHIDSFSKVQDVCPESTCELLSDGRINLNEDFVQKAFEKILGVSFRKKDWGGEENDLYTTNVLVNGERYAAAFILKGQGTKSQVMQIKDCGKNGDQIIRLLQSPARIYFIQYIGEISENVIKDIEDKIRYLRIKGENVSYCILNGQDTLRILKAYGLI